MRVVVSTYGSRGDVEPVVALAERLRELGARVRVCLPPDLAGLVRDGAVAVTPLGWPIRALATRAIPDAPTTLPGIATELSATAYAAVDACGERADVVVATGSLPAVAGAQAAAEVRGLPFVRMCPSPCFLPSPHHPPLPWPGQTVSAGDPDHRAQWARSAEHVHSMFGEAINAQRASVGLPPVPDVHTHAFTPTPWLAADPVLGPWTRPADLDVVATGAWIRPDERPLPPDLEAFLDAGPPPVFVGFGSMALAEPQLAARAVIEAVRAHGRRVVLGSGWADLAPVDEQDDCAVVDDVDHRALFRRVAAVVHHGGAGTTTTAARAGAPQVVVPQVADQPYWAGRVVALGIGAMHEGPVPTVDSLSTALHTVLTPETRARARAVAPTIRGDGATVAATLLRDVVHGRRAG